MSQPLVVGVVSSASSQSGGAYSYESRLAEVLAGISSTVAGTPVRVVHIESNLRGNQRAFRSGFIAAASTFRRRLISEPSAGEKLNLELQRMGCDLAYFLSPNWLMTAVKNTPIISTVWDVGHRELVEYPEFLGKEWSSRETLFRENLPRSFHIFTDSKKTGEKIQALYGVEQSRWTALPFSSIWRSSRDLAGPTSQPVIDFPYIYYPARFWPHKNHRVLVEAMGLLQNTCPDLRLVLTGNRGEHHGVEELIQASSQSGRIVDLGFVSEEVVSRLTRHARALVMPSMLGPTNIPPIEALLYGVPCLVSDVHFFEPEVDRRVVKVDPFNADAWALNIARCSDSRASSFFEFSGAEASEIIRSALDRFELSRRRWLPG